RQGPHPDTAGSPRPAAGDSDVPSHRNADARPLADRRVARDLRGASGDAEAGTRAGAALLADRDRKSTRLNSSHVKISYAVFSLTSSPTQLYTLSFTTLFRS